MIKDIFLIIWCVVAFWLLYLVYVIISEWSFSNPILSTSLIPIFLNLITPTLKTNDRTTIHTANGARN